MPGHLLVLLSRSSRTDVVDTVALLEATIGQQTLLNDLAKLFPHHLIFFDFIYAGAYGKISCPVLPDQLEPQL